MTLLDSSFTPIKQAHPGGFFFDIDRSRRIQTILSLASRLTRVVVIAGSESEARSISERLTLRGVPVLLAGNAGDASAVSALDASSTAALITTAEFIEKNGPIHAPVTVHLRPPISPRSYAKRLRWAKSAVHLTFVTPEDEQRAGELRSALSPQASTGVCVANDLDDLVDLSRSTEVASIEQPRRRFTFRSS